MTMIEDRLDMAINELQWTIDEYILELRRTKPPYQAFYYPKKIKLRLKVLADLHMRAQDERRERKHAQDVEQVEEPS